MKLKVGDKVYLPYTIDKLIDNNVELSNEFISHIFSEQYVSNMAVPFKHKVPQVAIDYYNYYKDGLTSFEEWFGDFYSADFLEQFPKGSELAKWLYDNDDKINVERELALATLITYGENAVEVIKEPKYKVFMQGASDIFSQLKLDTNGEWFFGSPVTSQSDFKTNFSKEELEQMGLSEVLTSSIFRVEETI